jgi:predicted MFS family arabinose efflux permease
MPLALYALAAATFAIGTTEFVVVGLVPGIAADLGVSIRTAGLLVSLYALSIALGTPIFSALTGAFPRRRLAIAPMAIFTACNLSAALATNYTTLLLSRVVMAIAHGALRRCCVRYFPGSQVKGWQRCCRDDGRAHGCDGSGRATRFVDRPTI